jgi:pSer/pThr/pTyr-binding forkhead associated (FHA) protein
MNAPRRLTSAELERLSAAERDGVPFLVWREAGGGDLHIMALAGRDSVTVGRRGSNDLALTGDAAASRAHAVLERVGDEWIVLDNGLSRNGTFLDGERITRRERLSDGSRLVFGSTVVQFNDPRASDSAVTTVPAGDVDSRALVASLALTTIQRAVLAALCGPYRATPRQTLPATNAEIAGEVFLGVDAVKANLRELYRRFGIADLPQNRKRARLAELAMELGLAHADRPAP